MTKRTAAATGARPTAAQVNACITRLLGTDVPLRAEKDNGVLYLRDNVNEAEISCETMNDVARLIHEWAIFTGYTCEEFEEFVR